MEPEKDSFWMEVARGIVIAAIVVGVMIYLPPIIALWGIQ